MAGLGERYTLSHSDLRAAFDKAKADGKTYMAKMSYTTDGMPMGMAGFGFLLEMIDIREDTLGISPDTMEEDFLGFMRLHDDAALRGVYNLSADFEDAAMPEDSYEDVKAACESRA